MKIDQATHEKWMKLSMQSDIKAIWESLDKEDKVAYNTVRRQVKSGNYTNLSVLMAAKKYFAKAEKERPV